ncbi:hypothetical protein C8J57DRAFT_1719003 [Mycena rebaudengoi]|nr:hypothetical protein C8J57DRAFT_1719003 [Mycena rebaudengoi]
MASKDKLTGRKTVGRCWTHCAEAVTNLELLWDIREAIKKGVPVFQVAFSIATWPATPEGKTNPTFLLTLEAETPAEFRRLVEEAGQGGRDPRPLSAQARDSEGASGGSRRKAGQEGKDEELKTSAKTEEGYVESNEAQKGVPLPIATRDVYVSRTYGGMTSHVTAAVGCRSLGHRRERFDKTPDTQERAVVEEDVLPRCGHPWSPG